MEVMNLLAQNLTFDEVSEKIYEITKTENSYGVHHKCYESLADYLSNVDIYSQHGLSTLGKVLDFPADFIRDISKTNYGLAKEIITDRLYNYFKNEDANTFYVREFLDKIQGVVSKRYTYFDDDEVLEVMKGTMLEHLEYTQSTIMPERLHLRAIDKEHPLKIDGDDSEVYFCYFIDNSMVGQCAFKIRIGLYRLVCCNGLICNLKEYNICKQVHKGQKDIKKEFEENIIYLDSQRSEISRVINKIADTKAYIEDLSSDQINAYLNRIYGLSNKEQQKVMEKYNSYVDMFGVNSQWAFVNSITEYARDINDINRRLTLEAKVFEDLQAHFKLGKRGRKKSTNTQKKTRV